MHINVGDEIFYPFVWLLGAGAFVIYFWLLGAVLGLGWSKSNPTYRIPVLLNVCLVELLLGCAITACVTWSPRAKTDPDALLLGTAISAVPVACCAFVGLLRKKVPEKPSSPKPGTAAPMATLVATDPAAMAATPVAEGSLSVSLVSAPIARSPIARADAPSRSSQVLTGIFVFFAIPIGGCLAFTGYFLPVAAIVATVVIWKTIAPERKARLVESPRFIPGVTAAACVLGLLIGAFRSSWLTSDDGFRDLATYCGVGALAGLLHGYALAVLLAWDSIAPEKKQRVVTSRAFLPIVVGLFCVIGAAIALEVTGWRNVIAEDKLGAFFLCSGIGGVPGAIVGLIAATKTRALICGTRLARVRPTV